MKQRASMVYPPRGRRESRDVVATTSPDQFMRPLGRSPGPRERYVYEAASSIFLTTRKIGDAVSAGEVVAQVTRAPSSTPVHRGGHHFNVWFANRDRAG